MLFGMGSERFDNLLHLLRQLRKPKLADKLDNKKLSAVLTDALPPLDDSRIEPLANGFGFLDADVEELRRTEAAHRATATFLGIYRNYARTQVRLRADDVRGAVSRFDGVTREEREQTTALEDAQAESRTPRPRSQTIWRTSSHAAAGCLEGLDLTAVEILAVTGTDRRQPRHGRVQPCSPTRRRSRERSASPAATPTPRRQPLPKKHRPSKPSSTTRGEPLTLPRSPPAGNTPTITSSPRSSWPTPCEHGHRWSRPSMGPTDARPAPEPRSAPPPNASNQQTESAKQPPTN